MLRYRVVPLLLQGSSPLAGPAIMTAEAVVAAIQAASEPPPAPPDDRKLADEPRNDLGNARRLIDRYGRDLQYVDDAGWIVWDGRRWASQPSKGAPDAKRLGHKTVEAIELEAQALQAERDDLERRYAPKDPRVEALSDRVDKHWRWRTASGNAGRIEAMLSTAAPYLRRRPDELDSDPWLLNVGNGCLELDGRGSAPGGDPIRLRHHERTDLMMRLTPVEFGPEAQCPKFRNFLEQVQPDPGMRRFLQTWFGYCLSGDTSEQRIVICHGRGANGKSTLLWVIGHVLGEYAVTVPIETFIADDRRRGGDPTPDLVRLVGARLALASEPERGAKLSEAMVKRATGGERMTARKLFEGMFDFMPTFKLVLSVNEKPTIRGQDEGIWRRVMLVPFEQFFAEDTRRKQSELMAELAAEASGILNWLLDGLRLYGEHGLVMPEAVRAATQQYRQESDPVGEFLRDCTIEDPGARIQASRFFDLYAKWCRANGLHPLTGTSFGKRLSDIGIHKLKAGVMFYVGRSINRDAMAELDARDSPTDHLESTGQGPPANA